MLTNQLYGLNLTFPAAIMATFVQLYAADEQGSSGMTLDDRRDQHWGVGGDHTLAGFFRLSIAAGEYLDEKIESYEKGVFSYDFLEGVWINHRTQLTLPAFLLEYITDDQFYELMGNWVIPTDLHDVIDQWLDMLPPSVIIKA